MDALTDARKRVKTTGYRNSLVEWTLSPEWCRSPDKIGALFGERRTSKGARLFGNSFSGEIPHAF